jgi:chorismate mutase
MTTFNIGSQNAGSIQNVGGDLVIRGGIRGTATVQVAQLQGRLADLRQEIDRVTLPADSRAVAMQALAEAEAEAAAPAPRPSRIAQSLRRVTETLEDAGVLASAAVGTARALGSALSLVPLLA